MEVDWDLHAVVRGCNSSVNTAVTSSTTRAAATTSLKEDFDATQIQSWFPVSPFSSEQSSSSNNSSHIFTFSDPFEGRNAIEDEELHELYKPFFTKSPQKSITSQPISSSITSTSSKDQTQLKPQQPPKQTHASSMTSSITPRKRRKNQLKRICHVPAEGLSSDVWAWRKYGQKPIKGSPYPRGYYRCSSSKGCLARKQVERNRSDPGMFIVTYTAEHNHPAPTHRNSLAGSTRQKPLTTRNGTSDGDSNKPTSLTKPTFTSSSPATSMEEGEEEEAAAGPQSTNTESRELDMLEDDNEEEEEEEEEELAVSDIGICDDFFVGLEGIGGPEESLPDHFPASFGLPWAANNATTRDGNFARKPANPQKPTRNG